MRGRWIVLWLVVLSVSAQAQWLNFQTPGVPRTKDGKPNLSAPAPRTAEGKPDLSGVWMHETTTIQAPVRSDHRRRDQDERAGDGARHRPQVRRQHAGGVPAQRAAADPGGWPTGRWERDVFVVETAGFNDKVPLDIIGHAHREDLRITERFRRTDFGHMDMEVTFTDPTVFTKPITIKVAHTLMADADIFESFCENERDRVHLENAKQPR